MKGAKLLPKAFVRLVVIKHVKYLIFLQDIFLLDALLFYWLI